MGKVKLLLATAILSAAMCMTALAGQWKSDSVGWWYQNDDGNYPVNCWQEIDGKHYYFGSDGYMLANTKTPDGKQVGADGALIKSQSVSNITYSADSITQDLVISDYIYSNFYSTQHIFEITNNSPYTLKISINETAKNNSGQIVGADSASLDDIPSGCTVFLTNYLSDVHNVASFDTTVQTKVSEYYLPVIQNIAVQSTDLGDKVVVSATNNGTMIADFVEATAVFFKGDKVVYVSSAYLIDNDSELKPGASISKQISAYDEDYTSVRVHITGRRSIWDS